MKQNKKITIVFNWKMNPIFEKDANDIFLKTKDVASKLKNIQTVICPPYLYLLDFIKMYKGHRIVVGAQDVFYESVGFFTGMISPKMLKKNKIEYVILGHSERRRIGETDEEINKKVLASLKLGLKVILCVGEERRDDQVGYFDFMKKEILSSLKGVTKGQLKNLFIAYEPVWAISSRSKGISMLPSDIYEMKIFIKKILSDEFGANAKVSGILYGGSVNTKNVENILKEGRVDGLLIGSASLIPKKISEILKIANDLA